MTTYRLAVIAGDWQLDSKSSILTHHDAVYDLRRVRGARGAAVEIAPEQRRGPGADPRLQPARETVIEYERTVLVYRRGAKPDTDVSVG